MQAMVQFRYDRLGPLVPAATDRSASPLGFPATAQVRATAEDLPPASGQRLMYADARGLRMRARARRPARQTPRTSCRWAHLSALRLPSRRRSPRGSPTRRPPLDGRRCLGRSPRGGCAARCCACTMARARRWPVLGATLLRGAHAASAEVVEFERFLAPTADEAAARAAAVARIASVVQAIWPSASVQVFGSFATGGRAALACSCWGCVGPSPQETGLALRQDCTCPPATST